MGAFADALPPAVQPTDPTLQTAVNMYLPLQIKMMDGLQRIATGFPVGPHTLMTAAHVNKDQTYELWVLLPDGTSERTWCIAIDTKSDMQLLRVKSTLTPIKGFRTARLGERVTNYGSALSDYGPGLATFGNVMLSTDEWVFISNTTIPGCSGSAIFGDDGMVIGMIIQTGFGTNGSPIYGGHYGKAVPSALLRSFIEEEDK
jgi:S1-C subfamily serine protease